MIRTITLICLLTFFASSSIRAQYENIWVFGTNAGLDFNSGSPVGVKVVSSQGEGCASICDAGGKLLFSTDGMRARNRNGQLMPNGSNILPISLPTLSTTQAAAIAPMIDSAGKYYLFSLSQGSNAIPPRLHYSIVDMKLAGGMGDIIPSKKAILIDSDLTERMTLVAGNNCNVWLLTYCGDKGLYKVKAYEITAAGINTTPVVSTVGGYNYSNPNAWIGYIGVMKVSPDRKRIAVARTEGIVTGFNGWELMDFNATTGIASNRIVIDSAHDYYGACFSPDNSKVYVTQTVVTSNGTTGNLWQYDITQPTPALIGASGVNIVTSTSDIKAGPDDKLYAVSIGGPNPITVINAPNQAGVACQAVNGAIKLFNKANGAGFGLPNVVAFPISKDTIRNHFNTALCDIDSLALQADSTAWEWVWDDKSTESKRVVHGMGTYVVRYRKGCDYHVDTFHVQLRNDPVPQIVLPSTTCQTNDIVVVPVAGDTVSYTYQWFNNSDVMLQERIGSLVGDTLHDIKAGKYYLYFKSKYGCDALIPFTIDAPLYTASFTVDTPVCENQPVQFHNTSTNVQTWRWDFGDGMMEITDPAPIHYYSKRGTYQAMLSTTWGNCKDEIKQHIVVHGFDLELKASDSMVNKSSTVTLATFAAEAYTIVRWEPAPLFADQGAYKQAVKVDTDTHYIVIGKSEKGCPDTAYATVGVNVSMFVPDAFTPNNDGRNDYFHPLFVGTKYEIKQMNVYDRWGKLMFTGTGKKAAIGWDGTCNGAPAGLGVYLYFIEVATTQGVIEQKGDVTLLR